MRNSPVIPSGIGQALSQFRERDTNLDFPKMTCNACRAGSLVKTLGVGMSSSPQRLEAFSQQATALPLSTRSSTALIMEHLMASDTIGYEIMKSQLSQLYGINNNT